MLSIIIRDIVDSRGEARGREEKVKRHRKSRASSRREAGNDAVGTPRHHAWWRRGVENPLRRHRVLQVKTLVVESCETEDRKRYPVGIYAVLRQSTHVPKKKLEREAGCWYRENV